MTTDDWQENPSKEHMIDENKLNVHENKLTEHNCDNCILVYCNILICHYTELVHKLRFLAYRLNI